MPVQQESRGYIMPDFSHLWGETFPIPPHAIMALAAFGLGALQFASKKGTDLHRALGYVWVFLMAAVAITALFIHELRVWGPFSPIHLLIPLVLISLGLAVRAARRGDIRRHRSIMISLYVFALVVTGGFTLLPGRAMHQVLFGAG